MFTNAPPGLSMRLISVSAASTSGMYSSAWVDVAASQDASSRPVSSASLSRNEILVNSPHAVLAWQLIGAWIEPTDRSIVANRLGKVTEKLSAAAADIDDLVASAERQIFQNWTDGGICLRRLPP